MKSVLCIFVAVAAVVVVGQTEEEMTSTVDPMDCELITSHFQEAVGACESSQTQPPSELSEDDKVDRLMSSHGSCIIGQLTGRAAFFDKMVNLCKEDGKLTLSAVMCVGISLSEVCEVQSDDEEEVTEGGDDVGENEEN